jgi:hypothetical protein
MKITLYLSNQLKADLFAPNYLRKKPIDFFPCPYEDETLMLLLSKRRVFFGGFNDPIL